jgi:hypothetical protein
VALGHEDQLTATSDGSAEPAAGLGVDDGCAFVPPNGHAQFRTLLESGREEEGFAPFAVEADARPFEGGADPTELGHLALRQKASALVDDHPAPVVLEATTNHARARHADAAAALHGVNVERAEPGC